MLPKPHGKAYPALVGMSMASLLQLVKDHHLASLLGVYKRMAKTELINALRKYEKKVPGSKSKAAAISTPKMKVPKAPPAPKKPKVAVARTTQQKRMPNITNKPTKKRIAPTLIKSTSAEPFESKGGPKGVTTYNKAIKKSKKRQRRWMQARKVKSWSATHRFGKVPGLKRSTTIEQGGRIKDRVRKRHKTV